MASTLSAEGRAVTDATVDVLADVVGGSESAEPVPAESFLQPWVYELNLYIDKPGDWNFEIVIDIPLGKTVVEVPLEVESEEEAVARFGGETLVTNGAEPGQAPTQQPSVAQPTTRPGQGTELIDGIQTREAETQLGATSQTPNENAVVSQTITDPTLEGGGLNWAFIAVPLAIIALGVTIWAFRRRQSPEPSPTGRENTPRPGRRRRR